MRKRQLPIAGQFLIPRGNRSFAMQVVRYQDNGTALCHRWDVDENKRPTKQTQFGRNYFIEDLKPLPLGAIGELFKCGGVGIYHGNAYDICGSVQMDLFNTANAESEAS